MNKAIIDLWADIGSEDYWKDLLVRNPRVFVPFEERWPQPGFIGENYFDLTPQVVVLAQNPRASNTATASNADMEMFRRIQRHSQVRSDDSLGELFSMMCDFMLGISYKPAWKPVTAVTRHLGLVLDDIAYLNTIPLATRNDQIVPAFRSAFDRSTRLQLGHLNPDKIVVFGKGAYEKLQDIGVDEWDMRYIEQRDFKDVPSVKRWLDSC